MTKPIIAIVGYGQFGKFMAKHLRPHARIIPITRTSNPVLIAKAQIVILAVPFQHLTEAVETIKPFVRPEVYIIDVTSIKEAPLALLANHFPHHHILGTHPIFGPRSGKRGIVGLPIVLTNVSFPPTAYRAVKKWIGTALGLRIIELTATAHDEQMALVQGLTHFIGRAVTNMGITSLPTNTASYQHLVELQNLIGNDSWELFTTIQNGNPRAGAIRREFLSTLLKLDAQLKKENQHLKSK